MTVAKNRAYLITSRFLLGFGTAWTVTAAPTYVVEMAPPQVRIYFGLLVSCSESRVRIRLVAGPSRRTVSPLISCPITIGS